jgi:hypothetical protein
VDASAISTSPSRISKSAFWPDYGRRVTRIK